MVLLYFRSTRERDLLPPPHYCGGFAQTFTLQIVLTERVCMHPFLFFVSCINYVRATETKKAALRLQGLFLPPRNTRFHGPGERRCSPRGRYHATQEHVVFPGVLTCATHIQHMNRTYWCGRGVPVDDSPVDDSPIDDGPIDDKSR